MKIIFFGSSAYCLPILKSVQKNFTLVAAVTKPDKPVGRKQIRTPSAVKSFALSHKISVYSPKDKSELLGLKNQLADFKPDLFLVADYGMIIPKEIFDIPKLKTVNIHFSRLPKYRGASPVQFTLLNGDSDACITYQIMDEKMDTGDILYQKDVPLAGNETTKDLYEKLFDIAALELPAILNQYAENKIKPIPQDNSKATYTKIFTKDDGYISWKIVYGALSGLHVNDEELKTWSLFSYLNSKFQIPNSKFIYIIERAVRAFNPWPGVWTEIIINSKFQMPNSKKEKRRLKIIKAHLEKIELATDNRLLTPILTPDLVQLEGKKVVSWNQFTDAYGTQLSFN